jgi:hypothetical protein
MSAQYRRQPPQFRQQQQPPFRQQPRHETSHFAQFLPFIFLLFIVMLISVLGREEPSYSLQRSAAYDTARVTQNGVTYYVKPGFSTDRKDTARFDSHIDSLWLDSKKRECQVEQMRKRQARTSMFGMFAGSTDNIKTPACEQLHEFYERNNLYH